MITTETTNTLLTLLLGALPLLAGGCDTEEALLPEDYVDAGTDADLDEEIDEGDGFRAWSPYVSEENPPAICKNHYAVRGVACSGGYCDNVSIYCEYIPGSSIGDSEWTTYFSEEGSGNADERHCAGTDMWMTGVVCSGSYCDNLSLRCTKFPGSSTGECYWSGLFSEEQSAFTAPSGYYLEGMECHGSNCDNKRYRYCKMNN